MDWRASVRTLEGVFLEVTPNERIVFTNAFTAGWMPQPPFMVGYFEFSSVKKGARYKAGSRHWDEAAHKQHQQMGFMEGWTKVAEQLAALAEVNRWEHGNRSAVEWTP